MTANSTKTEPITDDARNIPQVNRVEDGREPRTPAPDPDHDHEGSGSQRGAQGEDAEIQHDGVDQEERPGRRETRYRRERNEARARVQELEQQVEGLLSREVARIAGDTLEDGSDLMLFMPDLADVLDDDGTPNPAKVAERAKQLVEWKPGLAKGARVPTMSFGQGRRLAVDQGSGVTWGGVLRGHD
ncbi:hypothetical protein [Geodermatophilus sp. SYSU D01105]